MFIASLQSIPSSDLLRGFLSHSFDVGSICVSSSQAITLDQSVAVNLQTNTLEEMDGKRYKENVIGFFSPSGMYKIRPSILDRLTQSCFPTIPINLLQLFHGVNQLQSNSVNIYFSPLSSIYRATKCSTPARFFQRKSPEQFVNFRTGRDFFLKNVSNSCNVPPQPL